MSQEKVNKYKEQKANRKEIIAKEKRNKKLTKTVWTAVVVLVVVGIIAAIGYDIYLWYNNTYLPSLPDYSAESLVISDVAGVLDEETEAAEETEAETEAEAEETEAEETEAEAEETEAEETEAEAEETEAE